MNLIFFGSHQYSLYALEALYEAGYKVLAVVTQPDRPVGRKQILTPTPVKVWALKHQIDVFTPKDKDELSALISRCQAIPPGRWNSLAPDLAVVCVYGLIIPQKVLSLTKAGFLNIHPSLLPKYRGATPVPAAIITGEKETGVSIMLMDQNLDHGPIITQEKEKIKNEDTAETLYHRLFKKGARLLTQVLPRWVQYKDKDCQKAINSDFSNVTNLSSSTVSLTNNYSSFNSGLFLPPKPQNHSQASFTRMLKRDDGFTPWENVKAAIEGKNLNNKIEVNFIKDSHGHHFLIPNTLYLIHNTIRALSPWPGAWTIIKIKMQISKIKKDTRLKLLKSHIENGKLVLDEVQLEGEKPTGWKNVASLII